MLKISVKSAIGSFAVGASLVVASIALAHAPTVTIDPIGSLEYATFPQTYDVTGTVSHSDPGNVSAVSELTLYINDVQEGVSSNPNGGNDESAAFSLPWNILAPGSYNVKVTARHGNSIGEASEDVEVISSGQVVISQCPAAPAIAGAYMRSHSSPVKEGSANWKKVMTSVAGQTGSSGSLWAANACNQGYDVLVQGVVNGILHW